MLLVFALAVVAMPAGSEKPASAELGRGVVVTPADGWTSAVDVWDVGENATALQKAGAIVAFAAEAYEGTTEELLAAQLAGVEAEFEAYRALPAGSLTIAGDLPALSVLFSGTSRSSRLEGELVATTYEGTGVVMLAMAPAGQLPRVQADLDAMLDTLVVPR